MANRSSVLKLVIAGDADSLKKTVNKSLGQLDRLDKGAQKTSKGGFRQIGKAALGAAAGIGAVTIAATEIKKSVTDTVDLAKATRQLQRATGLASEDASQLAAVLKVRGMDTNKLGRSFTTLARQIEAAKKGTGGAADAFAKLGVSQKTIRSGNFNQVLLGIADGFQKLGDGTSKASTAQQLFGRNSRDLLPLLEGGSKKLREQLGLAPKLSDAQVRQSLRMVNAQRQVNLALLNVRTTLGTTLMPILARGADRLAKFVTEMKTGKGEGGKFAEQVKEIWKAVKPAAEQLLKLAKAAFKFAAENPGLVKVAATLGAIGLALKGVKFLSAISGLTQFTRAAKALGGPLKKLFSRFGTRAGTAFAGEATGSMAGNMTGALAPSGRVGKLGKKDGKFDKWGRRMGKAAVFGFIAGFIALFGDELSRAISKKLGEIGLPKLIQDHFLGFFGADAQAPTINPRSQAYRDWARRQAPQGVRRRAMSPMGRGATVLRRQVRRLPRPSLNMARGSIADLRGMDPLTGGVPLEAFLQRAEGRAASAQYRADRYRTAAGDNRTRAETRRLRQLTAAAREAQREVNKLQKQMSRRDALLEIRSQFKDFAQGFVDAYATGLQNIADARLNAAQTLADKVLNAQLKNLDEEEGQSEEARRVRELRAQQEREQREREDQDYTENKLALETQLERAVRNGNIRGAEELRGQLEDLDQQRRETLRNREISDLSESLQRQRNAAQADYEARVGAAQDYYDRQLELNRQATEDYKEQVDEQFRELQARLEGGRINYAEFYQRVSQLGANLTTILQDELDTRATDELTALGNSESVYRTYVTNVNGILDGIRNQIEPPQIPPIPQVDVSAVLKIQRIDGLPSGWNLTPSGGASKDTGGSNAGTLSAREQKMLIGYIKKAKGGSLGVAGIARRHGAPEAMVWNTLRLSNIAAYLKKYRVTPRASGGPLSRSGLTMVGETGPELVMNGQVYSATRSARMNGAGVTLNVYPRTSADDPVALARALGWQLATR